MGNYYAVRKGKKTGIYKSWEECHKQVHKFKGAEFKKFSKEKEAKKYLTGVSTTQTKTKKQVQKGKVSQLTDIIQSNELVAYVDGSYNTEKGIAGYGLVLVQDGNVLMRDLGAFRYGDILQSRHVLGEIRGALKAVELAIANDFEEITIAYDYEGIESLGKGKWKAKKEVSVDYQQYMQKYSRVIRIRYRKIKSHSNNRFNDMADKLAKKAVELI